MIGDGSQHASPSREATGPRVMAVRPNLEVSDVGESIEFFGHALGWAPLTVDEHERFALLGTDRPHVAVVAVEEQAVAEITALYVEVDDLDDVVARCAAEDIEFAQTATVHPWGLRDIVVVHPDGHLIGVGEPLTG